MLFRSGTEHTWTAGTLRDRALMSLVPNVYYMQALRIRRWLTLKLADVFAGVDTLLMATAPGPAPRDLTTTGDASLLSPWSFVGFPALSLNGGLAENGMPLGLQFVGGQFQDEHLLSVGAWCEAVLGILPEPPL